MTYPVMTSRSGLALSDDGKWLAYFRVGLDGTGLPLPVKFVEIIEADTGKVVRSLKVGQSSQRMNALAFDARDQDVLLARVGARPLPEPPRLPHREVVARHGEGHGDCILAGGGLGPTRCLLPAVAGWSSAPTGKACCRSPPNTASGRPSGTSPRRNRCASSRTTSRRKHSSRTVAESSG